MLFFVAQSAFAGVITEPPNNLGLVGYWSFEDITGTGATTTDFSGNGNDGLLISDADVAGGKRGKALSTDGTDGRMEVNPGSGLQNLTEKSVFGWMYAEGAQTSISMYDGGYWASPYGDLFFFTSGDDLLLYVRNTANTTVNHQIANETVYANTWIHAGYTWDGTTVRYYLNGEEVGTDTLSGTLGGEHFGLGGRDGGSGGEFNGKMDEFRVYNRELSAAEVSDLYGAGTARFNVSPRDQLTDGLVGYWTFDGLNGLTDASGNGNDGTESGDSAPALGKVGQGYTFPGTSGQKITVPDDSTLDITSAMTATFWIRRLSDSYGSGGWAYIAAKRNGVGQPNNYSIEFSTNGQGASDPDSIWLWNYTSGVWYGAGSTIVTPLDEWQHRAIVYDAGSVTHYVDGEVDTTIWGGGYSSFPASLTTNANDLQIGDSSNNSRRINAVLDDLRLYNQALSASEIKQIYNTSQSTVNTTVENKTAEDSLIGHWTFDGPDGLTDTAGSGNNGTINGDASPAIGKVGQGYTFDGAGDYISLGNYVDGKIETKTISFWANPSATPSGTTPVFSMGNTHYYVGITSLDRVITSHRNASNVQLASYSSSNFVEPNEWHHYTVVWDVSGSNVDVSFYKDGVFNQTDSYSDGYYTTYGASAVIGSYNGASSYYSGEVDDVRVYNKALSGTEILQVYNEGR